MGKIRQWFFKWFDRQIEKSIQRQANRKFEGKVVQLLAMQFVYETKDGNRRFCLFRETWRKIDE